MVDHVQTILTEADLLRLGAEDRRFEIVNGVIREMSSVGYEHSTFVGNTYELLNSHVKSRKLGYVHGDSLIYILYGDAETGVRKTRIPDVSFIRRERLPRKEERALPFHGAPDLAIEVISPDDKADELLERIRDYFEYGTEQVWVLYPSQRELHQFIRGESGSSIFKAEDVFTPGDLIPGLTFKIGDLLREPEDEEWNAS
jgi:Uma2 family endonuclease